MFLSMLSAVAPLLQVIKSYLNSCQLLAESHSDMLNMLFNGARDVWLVLFHMLSLKYILNDVDHLVLLIKISSKT